MCYLRSLNCARKNGKNGDGWRLNFFSIFLKSSANERALKWVEIDERDKIDYGIIAVVAWKNLLKFSPAF